MADGTTTKRTDVHNENVGKIVRSIVSPIILSRGTTTDIMVLTESILVGIALACIKLGGDEIVLDVMFEAAKGRLAEIRLKDIETRGDA